MISYGASVSDEQYQLLLDYLATDAPGSGVDVEAAQAHQNTNCTTSHHLAHYAIAHGLRTSAQWEEVINRMISYGASVSDEQYQLLLDYLATDAPGPGVDVEAAQALLNSNCTTCHPLADYGVEPGIYTAAEWLETLDRMISYGASLTDPQKQLLLDYLGTD
jgi:hypothetical protein